MKFRTGMLVGFAVGAYVATMAGEERQRQLRQLIQRAQGSDAFESVGGKAKAVVDLGLERARDAVESRMGNGAGPEAYSSSR